MNDSKLPSSRNASADHSAFTGWGLILGIAAGIIVGLLRHQVVLYILVAGTLGLVVGAILDRRRR